MLRDKKNYESVCVIKAKKDESKVEDNVENGVCKIKLMIKMRDYIITKDVWWDLDLRVFLVKFVKFDKYFRICCCFDSFKQIFQ